VNLRERFNKTMAFETDALPPMWEFGYWAGAIKRWEKEGLKVKDAAEAVKDLPDGLGVGSFFHISAYEYHPLDDLNRFFELDDPVHFFPVNAWIHPKFDLTTIRDLPGNRKVIRDEFGIEKVTSTDEDSIPQFLRWPVESEADWEQFKDEKLNLRAEGRYPQDIDSLVKQFQQSNLPLEMGGWPIGFFGTVRYLMGEVKLLTGFYDHPDLIKKIINYITDFWIELFNPILNRVVPDYFRLWEDMCYKSGPLISPEMFREFMLPAYRKFTGFLKEKGVRSVIVDTDGNCWKLIPLFLEGGVTGIFPMEVTAGMDVVAVRKAYPQLQILGGIDKMALIKSKIDIDRELETKVPYMLQTGGYIPFVDHFVPPDVPLEHFSYYRKKLNHLMKNQIM
jgi:uroporphyrinogen decarboxylase